MRNVASFSCKGNSMRNWWKIKNPARVCFNFILIYAARFLPSTRLKNLLYRLCGAKIANGATFGLGSVIDVFFPELIEVGEDAIIGFNTTIIAHEFLQNEYRLGKVVIGRRAMVGANCTILAGVKIGEGATVSAMSLVNRDIPPGQLWGGIPARRLSAKKATR